MSDSEKLASEEKLPEIPAFCQNPEIDISPIEESQKLVISRHPSALDTMIEHQRNVDEFNERFGQSVVAHPFKEPPQEPPTYVKDLLENTRSRVNWLIKAQGNPKLQRVAIDMCRNDILFWVNVFCSTYNPRKNPSTIPFITYPYEDELILDLVDSIQNQKDILIDKSRDMGVTWCVLLVFTWFWQFRGEGYDFLCGSRKENLIDLSGDMSTLFEKLRFLLRNQPKWMLPKGFDLKTHCNYMRIINPESKSTMIGEATNPSFSRGGRYRGIFLDEFAFWEVDEAAWRASADSTNCRIVVSTPHGLDNKFAELRHKDPPVLKMRSLHWTLHPEKDEEWYKNECLRRGDPVEIAQELDINYEGSAEGVLFEIAELKKAVHNSPLMSPDRIVVVLDPAGEGEDEAVFYVSNNGLIIERKIIAKSNDVQLAAEAVLLISKHKAQVFESDSIGNAVADFVSNLLGTNPNGVKVIKFKGSEKAKDIGYFNRRDEVYHKASVMMKSGNLQCDDDYTLMRQLNATKYKKDNGRLYINSKEEIKQIVKTSPDRADAWVLISDALTYTHSVLEVKQHEGYRQVVHHDEVLSGEEYGRWGDLT